MSDSQFSFFKSLGLDGTIQDMEKVYFENHAVAAVTDPLTGGRRLSAAFEGSAVTRPSGFDLSFISYFPAAVYRDGAGFVTDFDWRKIAPNRAFLGNVYYVDNARPDDAGAGTSWATAKKSIHAAITAGNTAAAPYLIYAAAGTYVRANAFNGSTVVPSQPCALIAVGGRVVTGIFDALTWTLDTGTTYKATRSSVKRVFDVATLDADGDYTEIALAADLVTCRATPGTYWTDNVTLYVNRADGAAVTDANTRAYLHSIFGGEMTTSGNMYVEGFDFEGGEQGAFRARNNASGRLVAKDCTFKYSSGSAARDNVQILNIDLAVFINCIAAKGQKDGFNFHISSGKLPTGITINCIGRNNGNGSTNSNNGITYHDGCYGIDINGRYYGNRGADCAHVNSGTKVWHIGTTAYGGRGDLDISGGTTPAQTGFLVSDSGTVYMTKCSGNKLATTSGQFVDA